MTSYIVVLEEFFEDILDIVDVGPLLQHTAEIGIFRVDDRLVEDVAVESVGGVERSHTFNLHAGTMQQHSAQAARLGSHIHSTGGYIFIIVIHINA